MRNLFTQSKSRQYRLVGIALHDLKNAGFSTANIIRLPFAHFFMFPIKYSPNRWIQRLGTLRIHIYLLLEPGKFVNARKSVRKFKFASAIDYKLVNNQTFLQTSNSL